jgi:hypothetical protein
LKKIAAFLVPILIFFTVLGASPNAPLGEGEDESIARIKLKKESLPSGMKIAHEVWASQKQLLKRRMSIGLPLRAILNQLIVYDTDQAKVNYLAPPGQDWLEYGYAALNDTDGYRSMVMTKDGIIVHVAATTPGFEDMIVALVKPDLLQLYKIRAHRLSRDWILIDEKFLAGEGLRRIEQGTSGRVMQAIVQYFIVNREEITVRYYHCDSPETAEHVAQKLVRKKTPLIKRSVELSGVVIVIADSQSPDLNERAMSFVNW